MNAARTYQQLLAENEQLSRQLTEAAEMLTAIRTGQVDAFVVQGKDGHELYTLKTANQTYRVFIETMNEGAVTLNANGLVVYSNSMFASMIGLPLSRVIGEPFSAFVAAESAPAYAHLFTLGWAEDHKVELFIRGQNRLIPCLLSVNRLQLDEGISLSMILTDLTGQKETQRLLEENNAQLAQTNKALEISNHDLLQFASVASHDLQEPLRKILIFADLLQNQRGQTLPPDSVRQLEKIIHAAQRMKRTIVDILTYSRLSTNNDRLVPTDLTDLVNDVLADFDLIISEKRAIVRVGPLPVVAVNQGQMRQVFQNLINNALKFSRPGVPPEISISTHENDSDNAGTDTQNGYCRIDVADNGIGFDEQYVATVFSLFHRLNTKDAYEGSGIGLAITRRIMERHNGTVTARSAEGVGTTFSLTLPLRQPPV